MAAGKHDEAYTLTGTLLRMSPSAPALLMARAKCLYLMGNVESAVKVCVINFNVNSHTIAQEIVAVSTRDSCCTSCERPQVHYACVLNAVPTRCSNLLCVRLCELSCLAVVCTCYCTSATACISDKKPL
jgi:hypothetical protein